MLTLIREDVSVWHVAFFDNLGVKAGFLVQFRLLVIYNHAIFYIMDVSVKQICPFTGIIEKYFTVILFLSK